MDVKRKKFKSEFKIRLYQWILKVIKLIDRLSKDNVSQTLGKQLVRSSTSILSNYVEAHSSSSKKDFAHYFRIALRSANESKVWLALLRDTKRSKAKTINILLEKLQEMAAILASSLITMKNKKE
jgi:four helix bundle protein